MVNIIAQRRIVPEFLQDDVTAEKMAPVLREILDPGSERRQAMLRDLDGVRGSLGEPGAAGRVATIALAMARR
jgi:lipid-A-disaccharide synthase